MGLRSSPLTHTRQQQAGPALQRCSCIEYGMGRWHDGTYEHTAAWAVGHHRSLAQDGSRHGPLRGSARACTTAWAVGTTVPMSTRRHGPAVIAAHTHETAAGTARSAAVLQHARQHDPSTRRCLLAHDGIGRWISQLALTRRRSRLSAPLRGHCKQRGIGCRHDGADEHTTA